MHTHTYAAQTGFLLLFAAGVYAAVVATLKKQNKQKQKEKEIVMITHSPPHWTPLQFDSCLKQ